MCRIGRGNHVFAAGATAVVDGQALTRCAGEDSHDHGNNRYNHVKQRMMDGVAGINDNMQSLSLKSVRVAQTSYTIQYEITKSP